MVRGRGHRWCGYGRRRANRSGCRGLGRRIRHRTCGAGWSRASGRGPPPVRTYGRRLHSGARTVCEELFELIDLLVCGWLHRLHLFRLACRWLGRLHIFRRWCSPLELDAKRVRWRVVRHLALRLKICAAAPRLVQQPRKSCCQLRKPASSHVRDGICLFGQLIWLSLSFLILAGPKRTPLEKGLASPEAIYKRRWRYKDISV